MLYKPSHNCLMLCASTKIKCLVQLQSDQQFGSWPEITAPINVHSVGTISSTRKCWLELALWFSRTVATFLEHSQGMRHGEALTRWRSWAPHATTSSPHWRSHWRSPIIIVSVKQKQKKTCLMDYKNKMPPFYKMRKWSNGTSPNHIIKHNWSGKKGNYVVCGNLPSVTTWHHPPTILISLALLLFLVLWRWLGKGNVDFKAADFLVEGEEYGRQMT